MAGPVAEAFATITGLRANQTRHADFEAATDTIFILATIEHGGYIAIDAPSVTEEPATDSSVSAEHKSSAGTPTDASTRNALEEMQERTNSTQHKSSRFGSSPEGGFIELATNPHAGIVSRHPVLDDATRRDRSSEASASIGRLVDFDSADSECWHAVAATYSMTYDATGANTTAPDSSQPSPASSAFATACGAGALLASSEFMRRRWRGRLMQLLHVARHLLRRCRGM